MALPALLQTPGLLEALADFTGDDRLRLRLTALSGHLYRTWRLRRQATFVLFGAFLTMQDDAEAARLAEEERLADEAMRSDAPSSPELHSSTIEMLRAVDSEDGFSEEVYWGT